MDFSDIAGNSQSVIILNVNGKIHNIETDEVIDTNTLFQGKLIRIDENPSGPDWKLVPLFSERPQGDTRVWQIGFSSDTNKLQTVHGILITTKAEPGKNLQTQYHPITTNKSGRTLSEQALLEARRRYLNKYKEGYLPVGEELPPELNGSQPMLAKTYHHPSNPNKLKSNETRIKNWPVSVMRKIDGIRGIAKLTGNKIEIRSRLNNRFPHLYHIKKELEVFMKYLPPHCELDGELYSINMSFESLTSAVKTVKSIHPRLKEVEYWIFDLIDPKRLVWEERYTMLVNAYTKYLEDGNTSRTFKILQTYTANNSEHLDQFHNAFVAEGYEGIIIRRYGSVEKDKRLAKYRQGRTNSLVKFKYFKDEEAVIIGYEECTGTEEGAIKFMVKDIRGNQFPVRPRGSISKRREWMSSAPELIGKLLTIRYQELSNKGVPRFPVGITIRDYE